LILRNRRTQKATRSYWTRGPLLLIGN